MEGQAFQKTLSLTWSPNAVNASNFDLIIPAGHRLVIRQISGVARMPKGVAFTLVSINTSVGPGSLGSIQIAGRFVGSQDGAVSIPDLYVFNANVVAFAQGPSPSEVLAGRTPAAIAAGKPQGEVSMTVFGYLVALP